jgi:DNA-binding NarL/FixJ family response regulator
VRPVGGDDAEPRFGLLDTIRHYALERLAESGEQPTLQRRHAAYFLGGADVALTHIASPQQSVWLHSLELEHDNLRAALAWCLAVGEPRLGLDAAGLLGWFWKVRGHLGEGRARLAGLIALAGGERTALHAEALFVAASLALQQSDYGAARALYSESLEIRRELGDDAGLLGPLSGLGATAMQQGDHAAAEKSFEEALSIQRALDDRLGMAESLNSLANLAHERGDLSAARAFYEQSEALNSEVGYRVDVVRHNLGVVAQEQGDLRTARAHFEYSAQIKRSLGDAPGLALSLTKLGEVVAAQGDLAGAHAWLGQGLTLQRDLGDRPGIAFVLERFAMVAATHDRPRQALQLAGASDALREQIGAPLGAAARSSLEAMLTAARCRLEPDVAEAMWRQGRAMTVEQAIDCAMTRPAAERTDGAAARSSHQSATGRLTRREREVAALIGRGLTNRQIASELVVSERTADVHVSNILSKLELTSRTQLALWAVKNGLRTEPGDG